MPHKARTGANTPMRAFLQLPGQHRTTLARPCIRTTVLLAMPDYVRIGGIDKTGKQQYHVSADARQRARII